MKAFEKLWKCGMLSGSPSSFDSGESAKEAAQFNWRAALEWLEGEATAVELSEHGLGFDMADLHSLIKKELGKEDETETR